MMIDVDDPSLATSFFSTLASSGLPLSRLSVHVCRTSDWPELVPCLSRFVVLRSLSVSWGEPHPPEGPDDVHDVGHWANLVELQELDIEAQGRVAGLQCVLSCCRRLRCLRLWCHEVCGVTKSNQINEESPLRSCSLQEMWLTGSCTYSRIFPTMLRCGLDLQGCPSLKKICVQGLSLEGCTPEETGLCCGD